MYVPTVYIYWMHVYTWEMYIHGLCIEALVHWWCHQDIIMSNRLLSPNFVIVAELKIICWCLWIIHCYIYIPSMYVHSYMSPLSNNVIHSTLRSWWMVLLWLYTFCFLKQMSCWCCGYSNEYCVQYLFWTNKLIFIFSSSKD